MFGPKITSTSQKTKTYLRSTSQQLSWARSAFSLSIFVLDLKKNPYSFWKLVVVYNSDWILICDNNGCFEKPSNQWLAKAGSLQVSLIISEKITFNVLLTSYFITIIIIIIIMKIISKLNFFTDFFHSEHAEQEILVRTAMTEI